VDTARGTTDIRVSELDRPGILVELFGEFDAHSLKFLRRVLDDASNSGSPVTVDLSRTTFLDLQCARELAVQSRFRDRLELRDPSWQAEVSLGVCGRQQTYSYPARDSLCSAGPHVALAV
jgi:hypothetical protein